MKPPTLLQAAKAVWRSRAYQRLCPPCNSEVYQPDYSVLEVPADKMEDLRLAIERAERFRPSGVLNLLRKLFRRSKQKGAP